jgi:hypothetical protein
VSRRLRNLAFSSVTGNILFRPDLTQGSALSRSHARNVLGAFYAPRLPRRRRSHYHPAHQVLVVRLLCRRLYPQCRSAPFTSFTHCFGHSESRAEAAAICSSAHLAWAPGIAICGGSWLAISVLSTQSSRAPASLEPARPALAAVLLCWLPQQVAQPHRNLNAGPPNNKLRLRLGAGSLAFRLPPEQIH